MQTVLIYLMKEIVGHAMLEHSSKIIHFPIFSLKKKSFNSKPTKTKTPSNSYSCADDQCIPESKRCDSVQDCSDFDDEVDCRKLFHSKSHSKVRGNWGTKLFQKLNKKFFFYFGQIHKNSIVSHLPPCVFLYRYWFLIKKNCLRWLSWWWIYMRS